MRQRHLLVITQVYRPDPAAAGQYLGDVAEEMVRRGWRVTVLTANRGYDDPGVRYPADESIRGVSVRRVGFSSFGKRSTAHRIGGGIAFVLQSIVRGLRMREVDGVLVTTAPPMASFAALALNRLRSIRFIYWLMDRNPDQYVALGHAKPDALIVRAMDWLNAKVFEAARGVVVLDRFMAARTATKAELRENLRIIPPWSRDVSLHPVAHEANPFRREHGLSDRFVVMYSGNHGPSAPLDTLLRAAERLRRDDRFRFVFIGGGVSKPEIDALASSTPNIVSLPYQPEESLSNSLSAADVHVVSMGDQMVGIVHQSKVYGALAVARPILLLGPADSHVGHIIRDYNVGWQVTHGDVDRLVTVLQDAASSARGELEAMGARARDAAETRFSQSVLASELCEFIDSRLTTRD